MTGWIAILLLCTFLLPAQAVEAGGKPQESTETVTYQNADYRGLSAIETAEKKLASLALSSEMIRQLSADKLELIQNATQITAKSTYYVESSLFPGQMDTVMRTHMRKRSRSESLRSKKRLKRCGNRFRPRAHHCPTSLSLLREIAETEWRNPASGDPFDLGGQGIWCCGSFFSGRHCRFLERQMPLAYPEIRRQA